ncbi:MAG: AsmA family protein [Alphaproteobacteria bacterium]|nr:AsmA family protein [Alphaproteobacteria bacterium]
MKKLLVGVVILLVVFIAAALIGPSFINWNDHKAEIINAVRDATGRELSIDGDISLDILPAPAFSAGNVRLANLPGAAAADMLTLKALEIRLALAPLISGEFQVTSVRLIQPRLVLEVLPDGRINWQFQPTGSNAASTEGGAKDSGLALTLDNLAVEDALLIYRDGRTGMEERLTQINLDGSAASLQGPFQFKGNATARNLPLGFDLSVEGMAKGKPIGLRLNLKIAGDKAAAGFSGRIEALETAPRLIGQLNISAPDVAALQNAVQKGVDASAILQQALQLRASVEATATAATLNEVDLTFGPLQAGGAVIANFGENPSYDLALAIGHLDLDQLLKGMGNPGQPSTEKSPNETTAVADALLPAIPKNLRGAAVVTIEGLRYRGGVVSQVQLDAMVENGALRLERLSALLPGGSDLRLSGDAREADGGPRFDGKVELASNNLRGLLTWLDANPTAVPASRLATMVLTSDFNVTGQQAQISNMNLRMDSTAIEGAATILLQSRPSFGLALNIDRINLDGYLPSAGAAEKTVQPGPGKAATGSKDEDQSNANPLAILETFDSNFILNIGELAYNAAPIRGLSVELGLAAGKLTVHRAAVRDLAGANVSISGSGQGFAGKPKGALKLRVRAKYINGLAQLAGMELPVPPKRLQGLTLDGQFDGDADSLNFDIKTTLAGLRGAANGKASDLMGQPKADLNLELSHTSLAALSRTFELGLKPLARSDTPVSLRGNVKGDGRALALDLVAQLAGGQVKAKGAIDGLDKTARFDLTAAAAHKDLVRLLAALGNRYDPGQKSPGGVTLTSRILGGGDSFELQDVQGTIGDITLAGTAGVRTDGPRPMLTANVQAGEIVLDHFLGTGQTRAGTTNKQSGQNQPARRQGDGRWSREAIDLNALQALDADINLTAKRLVFQRYPFEEPRLHLTVTDGVMRVEDLSGRLFKGKVGLRATLNSRPLPGLGLSVQLQGADINQAMRTALEMDQVTGQLDFTGQFQTAGSSQWDLVNALSGQAKIHAAKGLFRGFDMKNFSQRLGQLNKGPDFLNLAQGAFSGGQTQYQSINGNWRIKNGVAETNDTKAILDASEATVTGRVHLPAWKLDLRAAMRLTEHRGAPNMGVHLYGPLDQPRRDLKTAELERWLLARLGRELLDKNVKSKGLGQLLDAVTGGGGSQSGTAQPATKQPAQPTESQPQPAKDPKQQLLEGLLKALQKK